MPKRIQDKLINNIDKLGINITVKDELQRHIRGNKPNNKTILHKIMKQCKTESVHMDVYHELERNWKKLKQIKHG